MKKKKIKIILCTMALFLTYLYWPIGFLNAQPNTMDAKPDLIIQEVTYKTFPSSQARSPLMKLIIRDVEFTIYVKNIGNDVFNDKIWIGLAYSTKDKVPNDFGNIFCENKNKEVIRPGEVVVFKHKFTLNVSDKRLKFKINIGFAAMNIKPKQELIYSNNYYDLTID